MRAAILLFCACAQGGDTPIDARPDTAITIDSTPIDGPMVRTLSQTSSESLEPVTSIACPAPSSGTAANNYYRVFDLASYGITTEFHVTQVAFQVEHCHDFISSAGASVAVRVGTYSGTPDDTLVNANMTLLASNSNVLVPEVIEDSGPPATTPGGTVISPIMATIPAGEKLLVEVDAPNGDSSYALYLGANNDGETAPAYVLAPQCSADVPKNINLIVNKPVHLLLTVSGWY
jgi:hypothetical protein